MYAFIVHTCMVVLVARAEAVRCYVPSTQPKSFVTCGIVQKATVKRD